MLDKNKKALCHVLTLALKIQYYKQMKIRGELPCCRIKNAYHNGTYKRSSDGQTIRRFRCKTCNKSFSCATRSPLKWQKKRHINHTLMVILSNRVSLSGAAQILKINPKTVAKKLSFLGGICRNRLQKDRAQYSGIDHIQFDELQTIEHTKCKPLSVAVAVAKKERKILGFQVSKMPATGHLANISRKKYGRRPDERVKGMGQLFDELSQLLSPTASFSSDECSFYKGVLRRYFPQANYEQHKGQKSCVAGQGELKKTVFDPIFTVNHTFAMMRDGISRLTRRTWNTTKKIESLIDHISIYIWMHNNQKTPLFGA